jgi:hypothetical protein
MRLVSLREFRTRVTGCLEAVVNWRERTKGLTNILASPVRCSLSDLAILHKLRQRIGNFGIADHQLTVSPIASYN